MENEIKIRMGIESIQEQKYKMAASIPEQIDPGKLQLRNLVETEILRGEEKVRVTVGADYVLGDESLSELVVTTTFLLGPFSEIVIIDEEKKKISFNPGVLQTFLGSTVGILRGVLFEKTKGTPLADFPLPLIPMTVLVDMNRFRMEKQEG